MALAYHYYGQIQTSCDVLKWRWWFSEDWSPDYPCIWAPAMAENPSVLSSSLGEGREFENFFRGDRSGTNPHILQCTEIGKKLPCEAKAPSMSLQVTVRQIPEPKGLQRELEQIFIRDNPMQRARNWSTVEDFMRRPKTQTCLNEGQCHTSCNWQHLRTSYHARTETRAPTSVEGPSNSSPVPIW